MKTFRDLVAGDTIYYYSHCKMHPRKVSKVDIEEKEMYAYGNISSTAITLHFENGKPYEFIFSYDEGRRYVGSLPEFDVYSCKEAANEKINELRKRRENEIRKQQARIEKFTKYVQNYGFVEDGK